MKTKSGSVVYSGNGDAHRSCVRPTIAIRDGVGEGVGTVVVGIRRVGERTVGVDRHAAVSWRGVVRHRQVIPVDVGVVVEDARSRDVERAILVDAVAVIDGIRSSTHKSQQILSPLSYIAVSYLDHKNSTG